MKSHEKISLSLLVNLLRDYSSVCGVEQDNRDVETLTSRIKDEGLGFFNLALPKFGADLEQALELGYIASAMFPGFRKRGKIPAFMQVYFRLIFDEFGNLLAEPAPMAIAAVRQVAYFNKKLKELCHETKINGALQRFCEVEQELATAQVQEGDIDDFSRVCSLLWDPILSAITIADCIPKHGPGATAERITGNDKFVIRTWHDRLENYFPCLHYAYCNENVTDSTYWDRLEMVGVDSELPVRVIAVPKTASKPRIIAIEPVCMQYTQQGLMSILVDVLENSHITGGHVNFTDQSVNQRLALASSKSGRFATLDLSDASDRVRNDLVAPMFKSNPELWGAIQACRSMKADVNGKVIDLVKFASMGSALCFPIECMFFYTLSILGVLRSRKLPIEHANVRKVARSIYVYGDDIVVPAEHTPAVFDTLTRYLCKVNKAKSFYRGCFRESCGQDAYAGVDVTPIYLRQNAPSDRKKHVDRILSWVETSNLLYKKGLWLTSTAMKNIVEKVTGILPVLGDDAEGVGWKSVCFVVPHTVSDANYSRVRYNKALQRVEFQTLVAKPVKKAQALTSYPALTRFFLTRSENKVLPKVLNELDNEQSSRRGVVTLKCRWTRPY